MILQFNKLCEKIKIKINDNDDIKYDFDEDIKLAKERKEINKALQWDDSYQNTEIKEKSDDEKKYDPAQLIFPQFYQINLSNHFRKLLIQKYGKFHDEYLQKGHEITIKNNKNINKKYKNYKNKRYSNYKPRKYNKYTAKFRRDFQ